MTTTTQRGWMTTTDGSEVQVEWSPTDPTREITGALDLGGETVDLRTPYQSADASSLRQAAHLLAEYHDMGQVVSLREA